MTYTATASASQINANDDGATASAQYILTFHDEVEGLTDNNPTTVWSYVPLWGSGPVDGNPNGLMFVLGGSTGVGPQSNNVPSVTAGQEHSIGYSGAIGASGDVPLADWLPLINVNVSVGVEYTTNLTLQQSYPLNVYVGPQMYTWPVFAEQYIRHTFQWKHFTPAGEHKLFDSNGNEILHKYVQDQPTGSSIIWAPPVSMSTPPPVYAPITGPTTPDP